MVALNFKSTSHFCCLDSAYYILQYLVICHPSTMGSNNNPPAMEGPTAKEKKYDRQLRLWGASGQEDLENSHVLLLNSGLGVVGVETLKNLILPGIGQYTIVDIGDPVVTWEDLGVNFFLDESSLGKPRAQMSCDFLQKHNPAVKGHWMTVFVSKKTFKGKS
jgi:NEDD8-activating enzyme E1 regulatory subunit